MSMHKHVSVTCPKTNRCSTEHMTRILWEEKICYCKIREEEVVQKSPFRQSEVISRNTRKQQVISPSVASFPIVSQEPRPRTLRRYF